jgi:thiol:disulfide interchange protein DsbA
VFFKTLSLVFGALLATTIAHAADKWQEDVHYFRVPAALGTSTPGKVEVLDVFSYGCPACNAFEPAWNQIRSTLPPQARVAYVHASFNPQENWPVFQRAFLAAQAMGVADAHHDAFYDAVWRPNGKLAIMDEHHHLMSKLPSLQDIAHFYAQFGVNEDKFLAQANAFSTDSQMRRSDQLIRAAEVDSTPTIIINGKYRLTPSSAGGMAQTVELVRYLVDREIHNK